MAVEKISGSDVIVAVRKLSEAATKNAYIIPFQTDGDFDSSRDSDSTATKSGAVSTVGEVSTDFSVSVIDSTDPVLDLLEDSLYNKTKLEFWRIKLNKKDASSSKVFAHYLQGTVSEDSQSASAGSDSTREFKVAVDGTPKRGYTTLPEAVQNEIDYVFKGISKTTGDPTGGGTAITETDTPGGSED